MSQLIDNDPYLLFLEQDIFIFKYYVQSDILKRKI